MNQKTVKKLRRYSQEILRRNYSTINAVFIKKINAYKARKIVFNPQKNCFKLAKRVYKLGMLEDFQ